MNLKSLLLHIRGYLNLRPHKENEQAIIDRVNAGITFRGGNLWVLIFAILIASLGLNVNSTAVIIGAMLISPLMGPIIGMGFAMGTMDIDMLATISEILRPFPKKDYLCASHSCLIFSRNKLTSIYIE